MSQSSGKEDRMSSDFVRYSPGIETIDPDLDERMAQIIDFRAKLIRIELVSGAKMRFRGPVLHRWEP